ncbi:MAG: tripartite tricarboxylate transporter TctB family protein [Rhizobiales bacterium]|nr:tripartite tricarboxylate transporter TctB family protein [Hyphomicrobiales bacterium]
MSSVNKDTIVAIALLVACGGLYMATLEIREPDYGQLSPATWPRLIIGIVTLLSAIYFVQSIRQGPTPDEEKAEWSGFAAFFAQWRNVLCVFALFLGYLLILPWIGMLLGGAAFVFLLLTVLGPFSARDVLIHCIIALLTVGGIWLLFTYGLGVILPRGELTGI